MLYILNPSTDPAYNLAFEEHCLTQKREEYILLWRNRPTVVIGAHQCARAEVRLDLLQREGVALVRRITGGGAVYHDLGNVNFSLVTDYTEGNLEDYSAFCEPVLAFLKSRGLNAQATGRNDLTLDGLKFSGTAKAVKNGRLLLHGTLLFDADLAALSRLLTPRAEKLADKGIKSVRSRVTNLKPYLPDLTAESFMDALGAFLLAGGARRGSLQKNELDAVEALAASKYRDAGRTLGRDPACSVVRSLRCRAGTLTAAYDVQGGKLTSLDFSGDFFSLTDPEKLAALLAGCRADPEGIKAALEGQNPGDFIENLTERDLLDLLF